jgi:hypothetical protein
MAPRRRNPKGAARPAAFFSTLLDQSRSSV